MPEKRLENTAPETIPECRKLINSNYHAGTFDLFPCIGAPMFGSLPHFLNADPSLLDNIEGLSPNREEHAIFMHFETVSFCMKFRNHVQFTVPIEFIVAFIIIWAKCSCRVHQCQQPNDYNSTWQLFRSKRCQLCKRCVKCCIQCFGLKKVPV